MLLTPLAVLLSVPCWLVYNKVRAASLNQSLCLAASQEDATTVGRLLQRGASPRAVGAVPYTNCDSGAPGCVCETAPLPALSLAVDDPTTKYSDPRDPVAVAHYDEALDTVAILLRAGADPNEDGAATLISARSPRMVRLLLAHGAKVDLRGEDGITALMADVCSSRMSEMNVLLAAGADVNARDSHGKTVLMFALDQLDDDPTVGVARTLIAAGARVNARDDQGKTALRYALDNNQTDSVRFLNKIGARL